jgi:hypothetical protein
MPLGTCGAPLVLVGWRASPPPSTRLLLVRLGSRSGARRPGDGLVLPLFAARFIDARLESPAWPRWRVVLGGLGVAALLQWHVKEGVLSAHHQRRSEMGDVTAHGTSAPCSTAAGSSTLWPRRRSRRVARLDRAHRSAGRRDVGIAQARPRVLPRAPLKASLHRGAAAARAQRLQVCPMMLAAYVPLVAPFGRAGVRATHLLVVIIGAMSGLCCSASACCGVTPCSIPTPISFPPR